MKIKIFTAAMATMAAFSAITAGSAFATATTEAKQWYTGPTEAAVVTLPVGNSQSITAEDGEHPGIGKKFTLASTLGTSNTALDLTATGIECESCVIENKAVGGGAVVATGKGKLVFSKVETMAPTGCKVKEEKVTTNPIVIEAHYMEGTKWLWKFKPETGEALAAITLESASPGSCALAGVYPLKTAELFAEARNQTNVFKTTQEIIFSATINTTAGGNLYISSTSHPAELTGTSIFRAEGKFFGVK